MRNKKYVKQLLSIVMIGLLSLNEPMIALAESEALLTSELPAQVVDVIDADDTAGEATDYEEVTADEFVDEPQEVAGSEDEELFQDGTEDAQTDLYDGETMVILGASGSGKSTLLKLIIGLLKPDSGSIKVNGKEISSLTEREMNEERRRMGMVFQYSALFDSMNVKENVAFGLRQHTDLSEEEIENITEGKLHLVGLDDVGDLMPADLSGGMKKRVSLARAIALNPQIILYDEPTAGLDPIRATDISLLIKQMQKEMKVTSIVVTHDLKSAEMVADRMAFLYKGSFLAVGTAEALASSRDYRVKQFMNGLPSEQYTVRAGEFS